MKLRFLIPLPALICAIPAHAALPAPVRAMIDAAIATGDKHKVEAVVEVARTTNPDDVDEINALDHAFRDKERNKEEEAARKHREEIRNAGLFENWSGRGEIGGFRNTGNSDNTGLSVSLSLTRTGIDWTHKLHLRGDFQRSGDQTTRRQILASYEPNYRISHRLFAYGLFQFDSNRFQGFNQRYVLSGGFGYKVIDQPDIDLSMKAGPAFRHTDLTDGTKVTRLAGLFGFDFHWDITDRLKLTQNTNAVAETGGQALVIADSSNTTLTVVTGLEAKISDSLTSRLSYQVDYDSKPPPGTRKTDTLSRFTLIYGF